VINADVIDWMEAYDGPPFDFVFADTTKAKFERRDLIYRHLAEGGLLVADDLLPQEKWVESHPERVEKLRREIYDDPDVFPTLVDWASGLLIATHRKPTT
jgi:predicted O-methyltransferase YrrM